MINNRMDSNIEAPDNEAKTPGPAAPNESTGIYVRGFVKITDPETGKTLVETGN